jgi:hypothetical protein
VIPGGANCSGRNPRRASNALRATALSRVSGEHLCTKVRNARRTAPGDHVVLYADVRVKPDSLRELRAGKARRLASLSAHGCQSAR